MRSNYLKTLKTAVLAISVLLLGASVSFAQVSVSLTAGPSMATLPDGSQVPMWGYTCGTISANCAPLNSTAALAGGWSPVVITVPTNQDLTINLTNNLSFAGGNIPTSLVIVGQLGGGLGDTKQRTTSPSPTHENMGTTWPIANTGGVFAPPSQGARVQSFSTEVAVGAGAVALTWKAPRPGTYLLESGTHPSIQGPMGLYGIVVVTAAPANNTSTGTAYPNVTYNAEVPLLLSEIDPAQNKAVQAAVGTAGFSETAVHGPYGAMPVGSLNLISGGQGYTIAPTVSLVGGGGSGATAQAVIDANPASPTFQQVTEIDLLTPGSGYTSAPSVVFSGGGGSGASANTALVLQQNTAAQCSGGATACYPPAVNYTPLYYLINGQAFNKTNAAASLFPAVPGTAASPVTGKVLVRLVNAGLRMHVPSIVGSVSTPTTVGGGAPGATAIPGFSLVAEDGNPLPGVSRLQSEVFMPAGKTYDVMIDVPTNAAAPALPIYDRELSLSSNSTGRDGGMLAYIGVNGALLPTFNAADAGAAVANPDTYNSVIQGQTFSVTDPGKGVIANDVNVYGVQVLNGPAGGTLTLNSNGTFTYTANAGTASDSFTYCANGTVTGGVCSSGITATVTLGAAAVEAASGITCSAVAFNSNVASAMSIKPPGVLAGCKDAAGYPLTVDTTSITPGAGLTVNVDPNGGFNATVARCTTAAGCPYTFTFKAKNSQGTTAAAAATATLTFAAGSGLTVTVLDGSDKKTIIQDYRWLIEEDRTFYINPNTTTNTGTIVPTFGTNFHTSYMPVIASGCTGPLSCENGQTVQGTPVVCDVGNGVCRTTGSQQATSSTGDVHLDPTKRYYITIFPGDAANPFIAGYGGNPACTADVNNISTPNPNCGHGMGGAPIQFPAPNTAVTVYTQPSPYPTAKLSVFVFEDDFPLNGEQDGGGGIDVLSPNEPGLGGFNIKLFDDAGGTGDATGQVTYDMFNMPLSNSLAGTLDPMTGLDACPLSAQATASSAPGGDGSQVGITGEIVTCPKYEGDGLTLSPLAGQAVVGNLFAGRYGIVATPAADRIARGEEWLQTNTLDGQKAHDSFLRIGEPSFFQEYGPAGFHVSIGFANPSIINGRLPYLCNGSDANSPTPGTGFSCTSSLTGTVTGEHLSRAPDERLYSSGDNSTFGFTQCYVSVGDPDGEDFAFTKCAADGTFSLTGLPEGDWRITVFDQWNDMLVDGLSTPVRLAAGQSLNVGDIATSQWQANIYTSTFFDNKGSGVFTDYSGTKCTSLTPTPTPTGCNPNFGVAQPGLALVATNIRFRDGSYSNFNNTDLSGNAGFNEIFPLFSWYVVETDTTRYKSTGVHVVYDAGGPTDGSPSCQPGTTAPCGNSNIASMLANTAEAVSVPLDLRVPGAIYCATADCPGKSLAAPVSDPPSVCTTDTTGKTTCTTQLSTGRIDPPFWFGTYGWQGFSGQNSFLEFGKKPFAAGETGTIHGEVIYASTRPFDDPSLLIHTSWTPDVPNVTINLYQEGTAPDGSTSLTLVDTTKTTSWDDWAQGFYAGTNKPYMSCPGQMTGPTKTNGGDLFFFSLFNQPMWLDQYNNGGTPAHTIPDNSQFKCYDGMHNWNQLQPAPYDGMYSFPSITGLDPNTGAPTGTNCTICTFNPDSADPYRYGHGNTGTWTAGANHGSPMLPAGKYVVEVVVPPGYELVKEEDKNILIGDNYIAPATSQFAGLGNIFILPDQAEVGANYNANNPQNPTQTLGRTTLPNGEGDTGSVEQFWPCVGALRQVPDFISLYPQSAEVSPFAGAMRHLCDRKEVTLNEQESALAKFWIFSPTHVAAHFTGVITDDYTSEFDPFSPQFGEKFSPPDLPISIKDWSGTEIARVYSDHWGTYNGLTYSSWEVNPPNPTGYAPTMMITCMNDPGPISDGKGGMMTDPLFNPEYSQFCYEIPFMPGQTQYMDTPVVPTSAFAGAGYNNPDCAYPNATPAIREVDGDTSVGPWIIAAGPAHPLTITALGDVSVNNYNYSGPSATTAPYNQKTVVRHYGFGSSQGTGSVALIGADGVSHALTVTSWSDTQIQATVPTLANGTPVIPQCTIQQQSAYSGLVGAAGVTYCGQLVITTGAGASSIDTVTVTIGGKAPTHVAATDSVQAAIDRAKPGDLLMIDPTCTAVSNGGAAACSVGALHPASGAATQNATNAAHNELLIMWKPVRLQGVGAVSSIINANTHPAGKLNDWRARIDCLFGLNTDGSPNNGDTSCNGITSNWFGFSPTANNPQVDRLPLEATVGWQASLNGNLAELLQEPSLMGALEGAGITVLAKGVYFPSNPFDPTLLAGFPDGTVLFTQGNQNTRVARGGPRPCDGTFPSNFWCNPASIDGLTITDSSQGGGGVFVHGWGHNTQIANNRIQNNAGTLSGGINIGQGEFPPSYIQGGTTNAAPGSCMTRSFSNRNGSQLPYCHDLNVNVHHNYVTYNSSTGDELFSATPAGAGGVSFCTGSDFYKFNYNWVCGNLSTGDGGGLGHLGFSYFGDIEHNMFLFNQSTNPTIATNGGAMVIMGAPDVDPTCGATTDTDCVPTPSSIGPSDGTGPGLNINANMIIGNQAESGSGGGIALQAVNGGDVVAFPKGGTLCSNPALVNYDANGNITSSNCAWNSAILRNNIIVNNVAGWDGGGISLLDSLAVNIINNTIMRNDSTASSGVLFDTIGAPLASTGGTNCHNAAGTASCPQVGGLVSIQNSAVLRANLVPPPPTPPLGVTCPAGHGAQCGAYSIPLLYNDVFWQNRSFYIGVGGGGPGTLNQQNIVTLFNGPRNSGSVAASQATTGACTTTGNSADSYWDIGVRGDTGPTDHTTTGVTLSLNHSFVGSGTGYNNNGNDVGVDPLVAASYCNGSRIPPELAVLGGGAGSGWQVPPGIADATVPNPIFNLNPVATVDEGNNWINISWGPLALTDPNGKTLGDYEPASGSSPTVGYIPSAGNGGPNGAFTLAPPFDFFGRPRKGNGAVDAGAVEFTGAAGGGGASASVSPSPLAFGNQTVNTTSLVHTLTVTNTGSVALAGGTFTFGGGTPQPFSRATFLQGGPGTCGATLAVGASCTVNVVFTPATAAAFSRTLTVAYTTAGTVVTGSPVTLTGTGIARSTGTVSFTSATNGTLATVLGVRTLTFTIPNPRASVTSVVTITNTGTGPLTITDETLTVNIGGLYSITGDTCVAASPLAVNGTCTVSVQYATPTSATFDIGAMRVDNNGTNTGATLALVGR